MEDQIIDSPWQEERKLNYAGFWIRFGAYFIDMIIIWVAYFVLMFMFVGEFTSNSTASPLLLPVIFYIGLIAYFIIMESSSWQATLGKRAVGIKVGTIKGERISFVNALGRYFAKILSGLIFGIGYLMAGWDSKNQALHDRIADTYVFYA